MSCMQQLCSIEVEMFCKRGGVKSLRSSKYPKYQF